MSDDETITNEAYVDELYRIVLGRKPRAEERENWINVLRRGLSDREVFKLFSTSKEYKSKHRVVPGHPIGHFYSPIVDPVEVRKTWRIDRSIDPELLGGLKISMTDMLKVWRRLEKYLATGNFPESADPRCRYFANNGGYPVGDASILRAMLSDLRPKRVVEIGCGFSSACMLDTLDEMRIEHTKLTFIDPYPQRLQELLRPGDYERVTVIEKPVQLVDMSVFESLGRDDILFIDSSHVSKAGSDVNFELFEIIPRLNLGVIVHFHDIHYPFDYADDWVLNKKYSWNEIYLVRAFLMYNNSFDVLFFTNLFARKQRDLIAATNPAMLTNPGGSLWLRKNSSPARGAGSIKSKLKLRS